MNATPNIDRHAEMTEQAFVLYEFLDWLDTQDIVLADCREYGNGDRWYPIEESRERLLARYFGIDLEELDRERRALLEQVRGERCPTCSSRPSAWRPPGFTRLCPDPFHGGPS